MIYVVSGYMRSGTSMMCQCLEAGGMEVVKSAERDRIANRRSDDYYRVNPRGLYEPSEADVRQRGWPKMHSGKVVKCVVPLLPALAVADYRVVFMVRDPEEIRQSFEAAFGRKVKLESIVDAVDFSLASLRNRRDVQLSVLNYSEVVDNPLAAFESLLSAGWPIAPVDAALCVNADLYRFRLERLAVGI